jgi:hypothetical protein
MGRKRNEREICGRSEVERLLIVQEILGKKKKRRDAGN